MFSYKPNRLLHKVTFSAHCLERLREHHNGVDYDTALGLFAKAEEVEQERLPGILMKHDLRSDCSYWLSADRWGMFTVADKGTVAVTYLRFNLEQRLEALQRFGSPLSTKTIRRIA